MLDVDTGNSRQSGVTAKYLATLPQSIFSAQCRLYEPYVDLSYESTTPTPLAFSVVLLT